MTAPEKLAMLKSLLKITGTTSDTELSTYLDFCKRELIAWRYGLANKPPIARAVDSIGNAVSVSVCTFIAAITPVSGTSYVFTYSESAASWQYVSADVDLADYGLDYPDDITPVDAETITVKYSEAALAEFDTTMVMAVVIGYSISGNEGQLAGSENGISRTWEYSNMAAYIRKNVPVMVGVV